MARIVSLGAALQDIYLMDHDDLTPTQIGESAILGKVIVGSKVDIDRMYHLVGGGGVNSAVSLARYGHEVVFMGNIGNDVAGEAVLRRLDEEDIDSSYVGFTMRGGTGASVILLDSRSGERTILTYRGASTKFENFSEKDLDLIQPDWLYVTTLRGDMNTLGRFFRYAHEIGARIMFNPGVKELVENQQLLGLLKYVDILLVNKNEAAKMVPGVLLTELLYHLSGYVSRVIITDGSMGGIAGDSETGEIYRFGIYEDVKAKDVTGAGDAFGSGFLAAYASGTPFYDSLVYAAANATAVIQQIGANTGALYGTEELHLMPIQQLTES